MNPEIHDCSPEETRSYKRQQMLEQRGHGRAFLVLIEACARWPSSIKRQIDFFAWVAAFNRTDRRRLLPTWDAREEMKKFLLNTVNDMSERGCPIGSLFEFDIDYVAEFVKTWKRSARSSAALRGKLRLLEAYLFTTADPEHVHLWRPMQSVLIERGVDPRHWNGGSRRNRNQ